MTASNEPLGGLVGGAATLTRSARKALSVIANPDRWALYLVLFAGAITIVKKNASDDLYSYAMWFGIALGVAALLYEMSASKSMVRAWWEGRPGAMIWSGAIWAVAFGFSINNWMGAASENQAEKTNLHKAAYVQAIDVRKAVTDLEKELARLEAKHDWTKTVDAPDAYDDRIKAAEADAQYEATRKGCRSKCIAKQQLAANLKAERAIAIDRATTAEEIKAAKSRLDQARATAASTRTEVSENRNDLIILTKYAGMSEESAQIFNGLFSIIVVSILLSFGSMRDELETLRKTSDRTRSDLALKFKRWFTRVFFGRDPKDVRIIQSHTTIDRTDDSWKRHIKAAVQPALTVA